MTASLPDLARLRTSSLLAEARGVCLAIEPDVMLALLDGVDRLQAAADEITRLNAKCIEDMKALHSIDWPQCLAPMVDVYSEAMNGIDRVLAGVSDPEPKEAGDG